MVEGRKDWGNNKRNVKNRWKKTPENKKREKEEGHKK